MSRLKGKVLSKFYSQTPTNAQRSLSARDYWRTIRRKSLKKKIQEWILSLSLQESIMETCSVVLTFESVDEILWCDHSNETSSAVLLHGVICFLIYLQNEI